MKIITDLKSKRSDVASQMEQLISTARAENRDFTADEVKTWENNSKQIESINAQIERAEKQEEISRYMINNAGEEKEKEQISNRYSMRKAMTELNKGTITGIEREMHEEALKSTPNYSGRGLILPYELFQKRAAMTDGSNAEWAKTIVSDKLSNIKAKSVIDALGVTVYEGLNGDLKLPYASTGAASFVSESTDLSEFSVTQGSETLVPRRLGWYKDFSPEFLNSNSPALFDQLVADGVNDIWRALSSDLFDQFDSQLTANSGNASGDTAEFLTLALLTELESALTIDGLGDLKYATTLGVRGYAKSKEAMTNGSIPIWVDNTLNGYGAVASSFANKFSGDTKHQMVFGDFALSSVGLFGGGYEMMLDEITNALKGYKRVIISAMGDTGIHNPNAFVNVQNLKIS